MKKYRVGMAVGLLLMTACTLPGCRSGRIENKVVPELDNEVIVATLHSSCADKDFPREYTIVPAREIADDPYADELMSYTVNGLRAAGFTQLDQPSDKALTVRVKFDLLGDRRMTVVYEITGDVKDKQCFLVKAIATTAAPAEFRGYLPGLVAAAMPYVGRNVKVGVANLHKHEDMLGKVMGN